jgi:hypothetical protein
MQKHVLVLTTSAFILVCGAMTASAQQSPGSPMQPDQPQTQRQPTDQDGPGWHRGYDGVVSGYDGGRGHDGSLQDGARRYYGPLRHAHHFCSDG